MMRLFVTAERVSSLKFHSLCSARNKVATRSSTTTNSLTLAISHLHSIAHHPGYRFVEGDICDPVAAESAMRVAMSSSTSLRIARRPSSSSPLPYSNHVTGTFTLLEVARKLAVPRFVTFPPMKSMATSLREFMPCEDFGSSQAAHRLYRVDAAETDEPMRSQ